MKAILKSKGPGRGWHGPPKGDHTPERVPGGEDEGKGIRLSSPEQTASDLLSALDGVPLGKPVRVQMLAPDGRKMKGHVVQHTLRGRVQLSVPSEQHGKPYHRIFSFAMRGKTRGEMKFEYSESDALLTKRGYDPATDFLSSVSKVTVRYTRKENEPRR